MPRSPFLHDHSEFKDLIQIVSGETGIVPQLVEKDYWIMHCLWGLSQNLTFELKGGTSLSKGYRIIDRFSEDLDIRIDPPSEMAVYSGKNHTSPKQIESRSKYFDWVRGAIKIPGITSVVRDHAYDDELFRNGGIRLGYESLFHALSGVKEGVLLEVGFDDTTPNTGITISSWAFDHAVNAKVAIQDTRAIDVRCYSAAYTFVEKLQTVSTKYRKQQESGGMPTNFMRHYYDIHQLLTHPEVQKFIGTPEYEARKKVRFRKGDNLKISENEAFILSDKDTRKLYAAEYKKTASLYYKGQVPFDDILARIRAHIKKL